MMHKSKTVTSKGLIMPRRYPEARKWYGTARWKELRRITLVRYPICTRCENVVSAIVDHKIPHKGNIDLFFDETNLTGLCKSCHDSWKARQENGRVDTACNDDGYPVDPNHPWSSG